jgi:hypothetical protein
MGTIKFIAGVHLPHFCPIGVTSSLLCCCAVFISRICHVILGITYIVTELSEIEAMK